MKHLKLFLTLLLAAVGMSIRAQVTPPVTIATVDNESDYFTPGTKWYTMKCYQNNLWLSVQSNVVKTTGTTAPTGETGYWCFAGDATDGYSLYNRPLTPKKVLYYANSRNQEDAAQMTDAPATSGYSRFDFGEATGQGQSGYYYLCIHGTGDNIIDAKNNGTPLLWHSSSAKYNNNNIWQFAEVGVEVRVNYVYLGSVIGSVQGVVATGSTIQSTVTAGMPTGYRAGVGTTYATVANGASTYTYNVNVEKALSVTYTKGNEITNLDGLTGDKAVIIQQYSSANTGRRGWIYCDGSDNHKIKADANVQSDPTKNVFILHLQSKTANSKTFTIESAYTPGWFMHLNASAIGSHYASYATPPTQLTIKHTPDGIKGSEDYSSYWCIQAKGTSYYMDAQGNSEPCFWGGTGGANEVMRIYEAVPTYNYTTNYPGQQVSASTRLLKAVKLSDETHKYNNQIVQPCQDSDNLNLYIDHTTSTNEYMHLKCIAGEYITPSVNLNGVTDMNLYVYVDEDRNGFDGVVDPATHKPLAGSDLKSFSYYKEYNSNGEAAGVNNLTAPAFRAPLYPGDYRIRYKTDRNSIDPNGSSSILAERGAIVDLILHVEQPAILQMTYVDNGTGTPLENITYTPMGERRHDNIIAVTNEVPTKFYDKTNYRLYDFNSATEEGGTNYTDWASLLNTDETLYSKTLTVKLTQHPFIEEGKMYVIRHAFRSTTNDATSYRYLTVNSEDKIKAECNTDGNRTRNGDFIFQFEDLGAGCYHIKNLGKKVYLDSPNTTNNNDAIGTSATISGDLQTYKISNALKPSGDANYGAVAFLNGSKSYSPIEGYGQSGTDYQYYLHNNSDSSNGDKAHVVRWTVNTSATHSLWYIEEVIPEYTITYHKMDGEVTDAKMVVKQMANEADNVSTSTFDAVNHTNTITGKFTGVVVSCTDWQTRQIKELRVGETTYETWELLTQAHPYGADVDIKLVDEPQINNGKWYAIKHVPTGLYLTLNNNKKIVAQSTTNPRYDQNFIFRLVDATTHLGGDATLAGQYYIHSVAEGTKYYFNRVKTTKNTIIGTTAGSGTSSNNLYVISNAFDPDHTNRFALLDKQVLLTGSETDLLTRAKMADDSRSNEEGGRGFLHVNTSGSSGETRSWSNKTWDNQNSQWEIIEVPVDPHVLTMRFVQRERNEASNGWVDNELKGDARPRYTASGNDPRLGNDSYRISTGITGLSVEGFYITSASMTINGVEHNYNRASFFEALPTIGEDTDVIFYMSSRNTADADEVDVIIDLFADKGEFYSDNTNLCTPVEDALGINTNKGLAADGKTGTWAGNKWVMNALGSTDIADIRIEITAPTSLTTGISNTIPNEDERFCYSKKTLEQEKRCISFAYQYGVDEADAQYTIRVSSADGSTRQYYILQYEIGMSAYEEGKSFELKAENGAHVHSLSTGFINNITDTPCDGTAHFMLKGYGDGEGKGVAAATFFRVRVVNDRYLDHNFDKAKGICSDAVEKSNAGAVGYPNKNGQYGSANGTLGGSTAFEQLNQKLAAVGNTYNFATYREMARAYSEFISCEDLVQPEDCKVYHLSVIDLKGSKHLLGVNSDNHVVTVEDNNDNRADWSNRWVSHKGTDGKFIFVNKEQGLYLRLDDTSDIENNEGNLHVYNRYDGNYSGFTIGNFHANLSDYMASATDERLLGALYVKSGDGNYITYDQADNIYWSRVSDAYYNTSKTSAILIEEVSNGSTGTDIALRTIDTGEEKTYWASFYSYFPTKVPNDATAYYVTRVHDGWFHLEDIKSGVILPNFPVIIRSEGNKTLYDEFEGKAAEHLHIGELTEDVYNTISQNIKANGRNLLQGTRTGMSKDDARQLATKETYTDDDPLILTTTTESGTVYVLSGNQEDGMGFFKYTGETLGAGKAYYVHPNDEDGNESEIRGFVFFDKGVETRVGFDRAGADAAIYDLSGRRVNSAKGGLYIINGKKVVNKK